MDVQSKCVPQEVVRSSVLVEPPHQVADRVNEILSAAGRGIKQQVLDYFKQRATLVGLGLNKLHKTRELEDTPSIRGMVNSIPHLVEIVEERG